ncbi:MAG: discoidin domain-containing protein [Chlamydiota bacterium]|nr:discoidin domain-containing protein [Chlamydiota bacterium]
MKKTQNNSTDLSEISQSLESHVPDRKITLCGIWECLKTPDDDMSPLQEKISVSGWKQTNVPSNWFLNGQNSYPINGTQDNYHGTIWYKKKFFMPEKHKGKYVSINFYMVDYYCDVYLNGVRIGKHEGYFQKFLLNISDALKYGSDNVLLVRVRSPLFPTKDDGTFKKLWPQYQYVVKGVYGFHDARPGGTGEHGQDGNTGGIVGDVFLKVSETIQMLSLQTEVSLAKDHQSARISLIIESDNPLEVNQQLQFKIYLSAYNFDNSHIQAHDFKADLKPGHNEHKFELNIDKPKLWWTWDHGSPNLYRVICDVTSKDSILDHIESIFGIRSVRVEEGWKIFLNDRQIFIRGSNYISTQWLSEMTPEKYLRDVKLMRDANLNSIRVHAHIEKQDFYNATDALGIMVWQDFPLQWGYTDDPDFKINAISQIKDMVKQLYNHPSIILWCAHNESPWALDWMQKDDPSQNMDLDDLLFKTLQEIDPSRRAHINSGTGDGHPYDGWYSGQMADFRLLPGAPFISEYGAQALPALSTLKKMMPSDALFPDSEDDWRLWAYHNFQKDPTLARGRVEMGSNIEDFVLNSQRYQAKLIKFATELYRREKGRMQGMYHFMFVDCWPSITWSVLDYYRIPKLGYTALQTAMQPVLPSIAYDKNGHAELWIVNDLYAEFRQAKLKWQFIDAQNNVLISKQQIFDIQANSVLKAVELGNISSLMLENGSIKVDITDYDDHKIGANTLESWEWIDNPTKIVFSKPFNGADASSFIHFNEASCAIDASTFTRWESNHGSDDEWIMLELIEPTQVKQLSIQWERASALNYDVLVSMDKEHWQIIYTVEDGKPGEQRTLDFTPVQAKYIKIHCKKRTTPWGYSIYELRIS